MIHIYKQEKKMNKHTSRDIHKSKEANIKWSSRKLNSAAYKIFSCITIYLDAFRAGSNDFFRTPMMQHKIVYNLVHARFSLQIPKEKIIYASVN
jgi:hypothetical protein